MICTVKCISDGQQTVVADGVRKRGNPAGWACVGFSDGFEDWYNLESASFNCRALRSWRIDLDYGSDGMREEE